MHSLQRHPTRGTVILGVIVLVALAQLYIRSFIINSGYVGIVLALIVAVPAVIGAMYALRTSLPLLRPRVVEVVTAVIGTSGSLVMTRGLGITPLVAAAMMATGFGVATLNGGPLDHIAAGAGYAGAFVGLLTPDVTLGWYWVVLAGAVAGLLWTLIGPSVLQGVGGRMGVVALLASGSVYWIAALIGDEATPTLLPGMDGLAHWCVVPIGAAGALVTWMLVNRLGWEFTLASGLPSLAVCGVIAASGVDPASVLATAFWGGTFVGGTGLARISNAAWLGLAGLLYGALMLRFSGPLEGHVGVIGASGTIAVLGIIGTEILSRRLPRQTSSPASGGGGPRGPSPTPSASR